MIFCSASYPLCSNPSGFGVAFGYLNTFSHGIWSIRELFEKWLITPIQIPFIAYNLLTIAPNSWDLLCSKIPTPPTLRNRCIPTCREEHEMFGNSLLRKKKSDNRLVWSPRRSTVFASIMFKINPIEVICYIDSCMET